jgi:signal transduction histidine kinase
LSALRQKLASVRSPQPDNFIPRMAVELPPVLTDADPQAALAVCERIRNSMEALTFIDASRLVTIHPASACLLAAAIQNASHSGRRVHAGQMAAEARSVFESMRCPVVWEGPQSNSGAEYAAPTCAQLVRDVQTANEAANAVAAHIAQFIPSEDRREVLRDKYGARIHHAIQPALAYVLAELVDNVLSHSRADGFPRASAWIAAQYYSAGDLVRVAVVDDGCGLQGSLRQLDSDAPNNHFDAARLAFKPFVSSKSRPMIYQDRRHLGIGLSVCREIGRKLGGLIYSVSGDAWIRNPGLVESEEAHRVPFWQGTAICLELHRRAATPGTLEEALTRFHGDPALRVQFED